MLSAALGDGAVLSAECCVRDGEEEVKSAECRVLR